MFTMRNQVSAIIALLAYASLHGRTILPNDSTSAEQQNCDSSRIAGIVKQIIHDDGDLALPGMIDIRLLYLTAMEVAARNGNMPPQVGFREYLRLGWADPCLCDGSISSARILAWKCRTVRPFAESSHNPSVTPYGLVDVLMIARLTRCHGRAGESAVMLLTYVRDSSLQRSRGPDIREGMEQYGAPKAMPRRDYSGVRDTVRRHFAREYLRPLTVDDVVAFVMDRKRYEFLGDNELYELPFGFLDSNSITTSRGVVMSVDSACVYRTTWQQMLGSGPPSLPKIWSVK
jgi:hypothetical protein